jgi:putative membrane protein
LEAAPERLNGIAMINAKGELGVNRIIIAAASALALSACGTSDNGSNAQDLQSDGAVDKMGTVDNPAAAHAAAQPSDNAQLYVSTAAIGDLYEIESSKLALEKAQSAKVKAFAKQMIADHSATTGQLKTLAAAQEVGRVLPTELDPRHQAMLDALKGASGAAFDKAYLEQQAVAHEEALLLHANYASEGKFDRLKTFAAATMKTVQHHAAMVKQLLGGAATTAP